MALYRKWRPRRFSELIGQSHIVSTLVNQIATDRVGHAYLFCGSRGTGKTSSALIFARAVNCTSFHDGDLCLECPSCKASLEGTDTDIIEIDAASNNGVDEIRALRDDVAYLPVFGKYKVYIIDEVHMLSTGAFNALLKTLEEPPAHVIFILATTEPHKLPETIISRCQRFDFARIPMRDMVAMLRKIADESGIAVTDDALETIALQSEGGMRDAIGLLDKASAFSGGELTADLIEQLTDTVSPAFLFELSDAIGLSAADAVLVAIGRFAARGGDYRAFVRELTNHFRNLLICKVAQKPEKLLDRGEGIMKLYREHSQRMTVTGLLRAVEVCSSLDNDIKYTLSPRVLVEAAMIRLCRPDIQNDVSSLEDRIERLELQLKNGAFLVGDYDDEEGGQPDSEDTRKKPRRAKPGYLRRSLPGDSTGPIENFDEIWANVANTLSNEQPAVGRSLQFIKVSQQDGNVILYVPEVYANIYDLMLGNLKTNELIKKCFRQLTGRNVGVSIIKELSLEDDPETMSHGLDEFLEDLPSDILEVIE